MKRVLFILLFIIMFFNVNVVNADDICSDEELAREKEIANNISYNYKFVGTDDNIAGIQTYSINFSGITDGIYITDTSYEYRANNDSDLLYIDSGKRNFMVLSDNCFGKILRTIQLDLPKFNEYSLEEECNGLKDKIKYCDPWYQGDIVSQDFYDAVYDYNKQIEDNEKTVKDKFIDLFKEYYYVIVPVIILIFIIILFVVWKKHNKNVLE